jgi:ATP-dependent Clp protease ATP-binding subunit ClpB
VDETVVFHTLTRDELTKIVDIQLARLAERLAARRVTIEFSDDAKRLLAERGYDPQYGARPLKRTIQSLVETPLSRLIVGGKVPDGGHVRVSRVGGEIVVEPAELTTAVADQAPAES